MKRIAAVLALVLAAAFTQAQERAHYYPPTTLGTAVSPALHAKYLPPNDSYKAAVLRDGAVAYWRMDAASGTTENDVSGGGWTGTIHGGVTLNQTGVLADGDKAELFDGATGTYVDTATFTYPFGTGPLSVELWFKTTSVLAQIGIIDDKDSGTNNAGFNVAMFAGTILWRVANGAAQTSTITVTTYNDGNWHHLVGTVARGATDQLNFYIDGSGVFLNQNMPANGWNLTQSLRGIRIGAYTNAGSPNAFVGTLDDVAIYNTTLTGVQVANHYAARLFLTVPQ